MKKFFVLAALAAGMMFTSCSKSVEAQAEDWAKQMIEAEKSGDADKLKKINEESEEWFKSLSPEDQTKATEAAQKVMMEAISE